MKKVRRNPRRESLVLWALALVANLFLTFGKAMQAYQRQEPAHFLAAFAYLALNGLLALKFSKFIFSPRQRVKKALPVLASHCPLGLAVCLFLHSVLATCDIVLVAERNGNLLSAACYLALCFVLGSMLVKPWGLGRVGSKLGSDWSLPRFCKKGLATAIAAHGVLAGCEGWQGLWQSDVWSVLCVTGYGIFTALLAYRYWDRYLSRKLRGR